MCIVKIYLPFKHKVYSFIFEVRRSVRQLSEKFTMYFQIILKKLVKFNIEINKYIDTEI